MYIYQILFMRLICKCLIIVSTLITIVSCTSVKTFGQSLDTIYKKPHKKISLKPTTDYDQRFSVLENQDVNIWGYRIGVVVNDKFKTGIGGYYLNQDTTILKRNSLGKPTSKLQRKLYFGTIYFEPFLFRKRLVEMSLVFEIGYGRAVLDTTKTVRIGTRPATEVIIQEKQDFVPAGMGISFNFKVPDIKHLHFLTYIGINAMTGLRKTVFESDLRSNFDGWYWSIGGAIFIDKIFADAKAKKLRKKAALAATSKV